MMTRRPMLDERPTGKRVTKPVKLPDGRVIDFPVFVVDSPKNRFAENRVELSVTDEFGRVRRRGA